MKTRIVMTLLIVLSSHVYAQEWEWLNPRPTGNPLSQVTFSSPTTGFIVGGYGTVLKTTDGGVSWKQCFTGVLNGINAISFADENKGLAVGEGVILRTTDAGETWTSSWPFHAIWESVFLVDENIGYVVGYNTILKTTDGGISWSIQYRCDTFNEIKNVKFVSATTGFIIVWQNFGQDQILKTTDGGASWSVVYQTDQNFLKTLFFTDFMTGYASSVFGVLKTTDCGSTWNIIYNLDEVSDIFFIDSNNGIIIESATPPGHVSVTYDAGITWHRVANLPGILGTSIFYTNLNNGIIIGDSIKGWTYYKDVIYRTTNGSSFTNMVSGTTAAFRTVAFPVTNIGYVAGDSGIVMKTIDNGDHFNRLNTGINTRLNALSFRDHLTGFAAGELGIIINTSDGGTNWYSQPSGTDLELKGISFSDQTTGYIVGDLGTILKTTNAGISWTPQNSNSINLLNAVQFINPDLGYVVGNAGTILKTTNGGVTWTQLISGTQKDLLSLSFLDDITGYALAFNEVMKTTDGGLTWTSIFNSFYSYFNSIFFKDEMVGYIAGWYMVLFTSDGGHTWTPPSYYFTGNSLLSLSITDVNTCFAVGSYGTIVRSTDFGLRISPAADSQKSDLRIYPNPVNNCVTIETFDDNINGHLLIYNLRGQEIYNQLITDKKNLIRVNDLPKDIYFVRLTRRSDVLIGKFIKE